MGGGVIFINCYNSCCRLICENEWDTRDLINTIVYMQIYPNAELNQHSFSNGTHCSHEPVLTNCDVWIIVFITVLYNKHWRIACNRGTVAGKTCIVALFSRKFLEKCIGQISPQRGVSAGSHFFVYYSGILLYSQFSATRLIISNP